MDFKSAPKNKYVKAFLNPQQLISSLGDYKELINIERGVAKRSSNLKKYGSRLLKIPTSNAPEVDAFVSKNPVSMSFHPIIVKNATTIMTRWKEQIFRKKVKSSSDEKIASDTNDKLLQKNTLTSNYMCNSEHHGGVSFTFHSKPYSFVMKGTKRPIDQSTDVFNERGEKKLKLPNVYRSIPSFQISLNERSDNEKISETKKEITANKESDLSPLFALNKIPKEKFASSVPSWLKSTGFGSNVSSSSFGDFGYLEDEDALERKRKRRNERRRLNRAMKREKKQVTLRKSTKHKERMVADDDEEDEKENSSEADVIIKEEVTGPRKRKKSQIAYEISDDDSSDEGGDGDNDSDYNGGNEDNDEEESEEYEDAKDIAPEGDEGLKPKEEVGGIRGFE